MRVVRKSGSGILGVMSRRVPSLQPGCPWYELSELAPPNVKWCEQSLCSWVTEPANTWSNLGYIFFGVLLWKMAARSSSLALRRFGPAVVIVGVPSLIYHASYNFFTQVADFFGMFVFCFLLILLNLRRLGWLQTDRKLLQWFWGLTLGMTAFVVVLDRMGVIIQSTVGVLVLGIVATEVMNRRKYGATYPMKYFWLGALSITIGITFSALDASRTWCDPSNHLLQGHALWHLFSALCLFISFFHYRYFEKSL